MRTPNTVMHIEGINYEHPVHCIFLLLKKTILINEFPPNHNNAVPFALCVWLAITRSTDLN